MIDVKTAVERAFAYFEDLYGKNVGTVLLEEAELSDDNEFWYVTLSFEPPLERPTHSFSPTREQKVLKLRTGTGELVSIKTRSNA